MKKYAVKIMLSEGDWIYITKDTHGKCWDLVPETFKSEREAEKFADIWRKQRGSKTYVKVVQYDGSTSS